MHGLSKAWKDSSERFFTDVNVQTAYPVCKLVNWNRNLAANEEPSMEPLLS